MSKPFLEHHLLKLLAEHDQSNAPLDLLINHYFREHKALGSKDRAFLAETIYLLVRWRERIDAQLEKEMPSWKERYEHIKLHPNFRTVKDPKEPYQQVSFPKEFYEKIVKTLGEEEAINFCLTSNEAAPTTVRANRLKTTAEELVELFKKEGILAEKTSSAPDGVTLSKRENLFGLPLFKAGFFEMQDEASQLVAETVEAKPGEQILDFCAGSGGKSLAIAPKMEGKGQLYLHDIRTKALIEAKKRLARAGIQLAQFLPPDHPQLKRIRKKMDWVLVDAPCSGSGTLRRSPDMKWRFTEEGLKELVGKQRTLFEKALSFVKPGGKIVFATCSILKEENDEQIAHFLSHYPIELVKEPFRSIPKPGEMDGLFAATFRINSSKI